MSRTRHHRRRPPPPPGKKAKPGIRTVTYYWEPPPDGGPNIVHREWDGTRWWFTFTDKVIARVWMLLLHADAYTVASEDVISFTAHPGVWARKLRDSISQILGRPYHEPPPKGAGTPM